ncbi:ImmA/IrrE family metallo-endopeptidase [bacterium]|nr:ImmA/IrrE family metallo-endopeptidase [bacterium]
MSYDLNNVPHLSRLQVDHTASRILKEAEHELGEKFRPPIDPGIIAENFLGLKLLYCDMIGEFKVADLNGGLIITEKKVLIEESQVEVRANFTIGHEIGHWVLHRDLIEIPNPNQSAFFSDSENDSSSPMLCRASSSKAWGERQADWFSASLLMPGQFVLEAFNKVSKSPFSVKRKTLESFIPGEPARTRNKNGLQDLDEEWQIIGLVDDVKKAGNFENVSSEALRIRLQQLKLIVSEIETTPAF